MKIALKHCLSQLSPDDALLVKIITVAINAYQATDEYIALTQRLAMQQNMLNMMLRHVPAHERASAEQALNDMLRDQSSL
jgi:hypothetical protein